MDPSQLPPGADLAQIPAGRPPPGTISNFINPVTLKDPIVAINVIFLTVATLFVSLRIYTRKFLNRTIGSEDCMPRVPLRLPDALLYQQVCVFSPW